MKIYNTLSRSIEEFVPINPPKVGMYSCGPTVYDYQHIGHMRRYVGDDILVRVLKFNNFDVHQVMNITDVGHLTSDEDTGEDKMEKGSKTYGKSVWEIAKMFEEQFKSSAKELNIVLPHDLMHATDYIPEQIALIKTLEEKGFTYKTADGIYFDTSKFPDYFKFSGQDPKQLKAGIRVDLGEKKNISDFALWKFSPKDEKRQMEWESPWGMGFPGWHIECSAMSMKALGDVFDIHTGGIDHINVHHTNEIAQSEAASGKNMFAKYWVHHAFLTVEGEKMSKSLGNFITVQDVIKKGFDPLALRYLFLQTHYRQEMNFTWEALEAAQTALNKLYEKAIVFEHEVSEDEVIPSQNAKNSLEKFMKSINNDLNMPEALAALHGGLNNSETDNDTLYLMTKTDKIFGLDFKNNWKRQKKQEQKATPEIQKLLKEREELRKQKKYEDADKLREKIQKMGFIVEDKN